MTKNGKALLWVAALMIVIIYVYSQSAFALLRRDFVPQDNHLWCHTPWQCFIASLRSGLLNNLGSDSAPSVYHTFTEFALRAVFFDISFWIIITTICWFHSPFYMHLTRCSAERGVWHHRRHVRRAA